MFLSSSSYRNPVKQLVLSKATDYFGPDECIDDHVESKYFNNSEVCVNIMEFVIYTTQVILCRSVRLFMLHPWRRLEDGVSVQARFTTMQILLHCCLSTPH